jgi:hypothetical protein
MLHTGVPAEDVLTSVVRVHAQLKQQIAQQFELNAALDERLRSMRQLVDRRVAALADHQTFATALQTKVLFLFFFSFFFLKKAKRWGDRWVDQASAAEADVTTPEDEVDRMREKIKAVAASNRRLLKAMAAFGREYFPAPDANALLAAKRQRQGFLFIFVYLFFVGSLCVRLNVGMVVELDVLSFFLSNFKHNSLRFLSTRHVGSVSATRVAVHVAE